MSAAGKVEERALPEDGSAIYQFALNSKVFVYLSSPPHGAQSRISMGECKVAPLRVEQIKIQILREILEKADALIVKSNSLRGEVS